MQVITDRNYHAQRSVVVLGTFDGVHIGHRVLIEKGRALANEAKLPLIVSTFVNHPLSLIAPEKAPAILTTLAEKAELMEKLGVDVLLAQSFSPELMNTDPADYIGLLVQRFHPCDVVCGYNHHFGRKGEGTPALLTVVGEALGFQTHVVPQITLDGEEVSSTAIRKALEGGDPARAAKLLGHFYSVGGSVRNGDFIYENAQKVHLPEGFYRILCRSKDQMLPLILSVQEDGRMRLLGKKLPEGDCRLDVLQAETKKKEVLIDRN